MSRQPTEREVVELSMDKLIECIQMDLLPDLCTGRFLGIYPPEANLEKARFGCLQMVVKRGHATKAQLTEAWLAGGSAFEDLVLSFPDVRDCYHGLYLRKRGGLPGKRISRVPSEPDYPEELRRVPLKPGERPGSLSLHEELARMMREDGEEPPLDPVANFRAMFK